MNYKTMQSSPTRAIITGASASYSEILLGLLGSLNANWPDHPPVVVYDLGIRDDARVLLQKAGVEVREVPAFCDHWRRHFTWKIWCINNIDVEQYLWLDAGVIVLRPMNDAFQAVSGLGYFVQPNGYQLLSTLNRPLRDRFAQLPLQEMQSINGGLHGFDKRMAASLLQESMELSLDEANMHGGDMAVNGLSGRHDQDLLTVLLYKHFGQPVFLDRHLYAEHLGPQQVHGQRLWVHRRSAHPVDLQYFRECVTLPNGPRIPVPLPPPTKPSWIRRLRVAVAKLRGRYPDFQHVPYDGMRD